MTERSLAEQLLDWMPGDRDDAVAQVCRRFWQRLGDCACGDTPCARCQQDALTIERAWKETDPRI